MLTKPTSTGCCPPFEPEKWNQQKHVWQERKFFVKSGWCLFNFMLNFGAVLTFLDKKLKESGT